MRSLAIATAMARLWITGVGWLRPAMPRRPMPPLDLTAPALTAPALTAPVLAGLALIVLAASGCSVRTGAVERPPSSAAPASAERASAAELGADAELRQWLEVRGILERQLADANRQLLELERGATGDEDKRLEQAARRLQLVIALFDVDQKMAHRRRALRLAAHLGGSTPPAMTPVAAEQRVKALMRGAEERLAGLAEREPDVAEDENFRDSDDDAAAAGLNFGAPGAAAGAPRADRRRKKRRSKAAPRGLLTALDEKKKEAQRRPPAQSKPDCNSDDPLCAVPAEGGELDEILRGGKAGTEGRKGAGGAHGPPGGIEAATVAATGAPAGVMPAVRRRLASMHDCLPAELLDEDGLKIQVTTRLMGDGSLRGARLRAGVPLPPSVKACLVDAIQAVRAPAPPGGSRVISFPLWISGR